MNLPQYLERIRHAPPPTAEQFRRFHWYLTSVHSWYNIPLRSGEEFVVFLDPDVGEGAIGGKQIVDLGYKRETRYRDALGCLAYMWRGRDRAGRPSRFISDYKVDSAATGITSQRESDLVPELPAELIQQCSFVLYPYVRPTEFLNIAPVSHMTALREIWAGAAHPGRRALALLEERDLLPSGDFDYETHCRPVWDLIAARHDGKERSEIDNLRWAMAHVKLTATQREYARRRCRRERILRCLVLPEYRKVARAIENLRALVLQAHTG